MQQEDKYAYKFTDCYELQVLDANCNNCIHMKRDLEKFKKWEEWHRRLDEAEFDRAKAKAIEDAQRVIDTAEDNSAQRSGEGMMRKAQKMKFQFDKAGHLQYGFCEKFKKDVSFLPTQCQIETQDCFVHRRSEEAKLITNA